MRLADLARQEIATWHQERMEVKMRMLNTRLSSFHHHIGSLSVPPSERGALPAPASFEMAPEELALWEQSSYTDSFDSNALSESAVSSNAGRIFALAMRMVAKTLQLPLVYLLRLEFLDDAAESAQVSLVSSYGMPNPPPSFDDKLHLRALRTPEGGLLYQNPKLDELPDGEMIPTTHPDQLASAILVRVMELGASGYVLAGFADKQRAA